MSPEEHAKKEFWEEKWQIGELVVESHLLRSAGEYVKEGEINTEIYKLTCKVLGKEPFLSNRTCTRNGE